MPTSKTKKKSAVFPPICNQRFFSKCTKNVKAALAVSQHRHWRGSALQGSPTSPCTSGCTTAHSFTVWQQPVIYETLVSDYDLYTCFSWGRGIICVFWKGNLKRKKEKSPPAYTFPQSKENRRKESEVGRAGVWSILCILLPERQQESKRCGQDRTFRCLNIRLQKYKTSWGKNKLGWRLKNVSNPCSEEQQKGWDKSASLGSAP